MELQLQSKQDIQQACFWKITDAREEVSNLLVRQSELFISVFEHKTSDL
jgi:hypothetical protein